MIKVLDLIEKNLCKANNYSKQKSAHYPSDACRCIRAQWYSWNSINRSEQKEAGSELKKLIGSVIHIGLLDMIDKEVSQAGIGLFKMEEGSTVQVKQLGFPISFRMDFTIQCEDKTIGGEIKTSWGQGFRDVWSSDSPRDEDLAQVSLYRFLTNIDEWHLIYLARDSAYRKEFVLEFYDDKIKVWYFDLYKLIDNPIKKYIDRFKKVEEYLIENKEPPREFSVVFLGGEIKEKYQRKNIIYKSDWQCLYCDWMTHCWRDADKSDTWCNKEMIETIGNEIE